MKDLNEDFYRHISSEFNEELEALRGPPLKWVDWLKSS